MTDIIQSFWYLNVFRKTDCLKEEIFALILFIHFFFLLSIFNQVYKLFINGYIMYSTEFLSING